MNKKWDTRKITGLAMVAAISYVVVLIMNLGGFNLVAAAPYLSYEAKDVVLVIGGFIFGPVGALAAALIVSLAEMLTVSATGPVGLLMNFISSAAYVGVAALIYRKARSARGAALSLIAGTLFMSAAMLLWNYIVTPMYMDVPRPVVAGMLLPIFLPFNMIKGGLNTAIVLLIYKPVITALRAARLLPARQPLEPDKKDTADTEGAGQKLKLNPIPLIVALALIAICAAAIYLLWFYRPAV